MSPVNTFVIVGGGLAAGKAAEALREHGHRDPLLLIGDEQERPYIRPPLSKGYLLGKEERDSIYVHSEDWYAEHGVDLLLGTRVRAVDAQAREVELDDGRRVPYAKLLLATGSSPRRLSIPGADLDNVLYLRRVGDSERLKAAFTEGARIVVIGGGWIGLETAAAARMAGAEVTVLEHSELPLMKVLGREAAEVFAGLHEDHGVDLRPRAQVERITGSGGRVDGVVLADGSHLAADAVVVGVGITPNVQLAQEAGLEVRNGIITDEHLQTSVADIYAAGDVANAYHPRLGRHLRVEHWANALHQPRTAALSMLGKDAVYDRLPYFYTDQYDLGMEYTGYTEPGGYDRVVFRGDAAERRFIAFWMSGNRVLAGMSVNVWDVIDSIRSLILSGADIDDALLSDPDVPVDSLLP
ncbi:pyridine nucleotide-disulfide oxidoreductase [Streptomyces spinoverrucosus]|uniref:Pyridine nucleotide-disulfide oxidoreductase n=1 Tax=Streptomyces spinoverrucosus TaxID=284043 RepID=A0A4Y3VFY2_9ACTN|nr:FAD-dependent oxidoreductase [Streptomyces spinoverrucosus]GEC04998.1 pyridine nucleotide-disulfide oxidoreductase [Streptomyces spinoverrucosus]GHB96481.1 pyridine nucleotide-disulfide oxidoreductase [Streptomyces spinoverrucosus]